MNFIDYISILLLFRLISNYTNSGRGLKSKRKYEKVVGDNLR